jgi:acyl-CoA thioesterase YciA
MSDEQKRFTTATLMMPRDTNPMGNIFGGEILSHIDQAASVAASAACSEHVGRVVTVAMDKVVFKKPVHVGDVIECHARVTRIGTTSIAVHVDVEANRNGERIAVTEADAVYVAVNGRGRPIDVCCQAGKSPGSSQRRKRTGKRDAALPDPSRCPTTATVMMPKHTNYMGSIFAGVILSEIDIAGAVAARAACSRKSRRVVTVAMDKVVFKRPVLVGDVLQCYVDITRIGTTSISTHIEVVANRSGKLIPVTAADAVYVAVDRNARPVPVRCDGGKQGKSIKAPDCPCKKETS